MDAREDDQHHPDWLRFEEELGFRVLLHGPTYADLVAQFEQNGQAMAKRYANIVDPSEAKLAGVEISHYSTDSGIALTCYTPPSHKHDQPLVCYYHGGGFVLGSVAADDAICRRLALDSGLIFVSVEYRLAPQNPFPAGLEDCFEAADWCLENASRLQAHTGKLIFSGNSAGASLALAAALKQIDNGRREAVQGVVACQPVTIHPDSVPAKYHGAYTSYTKHASNTVNTDSGMRAFLDAFGAPHTDPYIYSLLHPRLKDLPRIFINACEFDTLRDDAWLLHKELNQAGVTSRYDEFRGLPHQFFTFPSALLHEVREDYYSRTANGFTFVLDQ